MNIFPSCFQTHGIGKPLEDVQPRGPNLKLRKRYRQMIENELEFDRLAGDNPQSPEYEPPVSEIDQVRTTIHECGIFYDFEGEPGGASGGRGGENEVWE